MSTLDGSEIIRGDSYSATVTFTNQADLDAGHPIKVNGFQTVGYAPRFTAKKALTDADSAALITKTTASGITIVSPTVATLDFYPADTKALKVAIAGLPLYYDFQFASNNGNRVYTMERGSFTVTLDASIAAP